MTSPGGQEVGRVSIRVVPDTSRFRRQLQRELRAIQQNMRVEIPVELRAGRAFVQLALLRRNLDALQGKVIDVGINNDSVRNIAQVTQYARTLRGAIGATRNAFVRFGRESKSALDTARIRSLYLGDAVRRISSRNVLENVTAGFRQLARSAGRAGTSVADIDLRFRRLRRNGLLFTKGVGGGLLAMTKSFRALIGVMTLGISGFGNLSRVGKIVVAVLVAIPPVLGLIGGLLAGLPSLVAAFGAGAAAVYLGWDGIKDVFGELSSEIDYLKNSISDVFREMLSPAIPALRETLLALEPGLQAVARGVSEMALGIIDVVNSGTGMVYMNNILENTATLFSDLTPAVQGFTRNFLLMASEGSKQFGLLSDVLNDSVSGFKELLEQSIETGQFAAAIEGLAKVTDSLFQSLNKLIFAGVEAMAVIGDDLAGGLTAFFDLVVALMPALTALSAVVLQVVEAIATTLIPIFEELTPVFQEVMEIVADALIPIIRALGPPLQALAQFGLELFQALSPIFPVLTTIAQVLGGILQTALRALEPVLPVIADAMESVADVINTALVKAIPVLNQIADALGDALGDAIKALAPVLPELIQSFLDLVIALLPLLPPLIDLVGTILPPLIRIIGLVVPPVLRLAEGLADFLVPAINWVIEVIEDVLGFFLSIQEGLAQTARVILDWFRDLPGKIWNLVKDAGKWLVSTGRNIVDGIRVGIIEKWNQFTGWLDGLVGGLIDEVLGWFGINSPSKVFAEIGEQLMAGLRVGIDDSAPEALKSLQNVTDEMTNLGSDMNSTITAEGGMTVMSDGITEAVERGIQGWDFSVNKFGISRLNRNAERYNEFGR